MRYFLSFLILGNSLLPTHASTPTHGAKLCSEIPAPHVLGATIASIDSAIRTNFSVQSSPPTLAQDIVNLNVCEVNVTLTHTGSSDHVLVQTWLPLKSWNKRFVAIGGGAWAAGLGAIDLALPASQGYAVSSTNAGLSGNPLSPDLWALKEDGTVNFELLENFASRSIHDMAVVGQAVAASFYGRPVKTSLWNGCSTGGRQGLVAAQKYPEDFDGILAGAPAIYWTEYVVAELWPQVVMKEEGYYPSNCELDGIVQAAIRACDNKDKVKDGIITSPFNCKFDPFTAVGTMAQCGEEQVEITSQGAAIVRKIWDGPKTPSGERLWPGIPIGASFAALAYTTTEANGVNGTGVPFFLADAWVRYFVKENPEFDTTSLDSAQLVELFYESKSKFGSIMDSADPDLSKFKKAGGKLLVWHGLADQLIYPQDSIRYLQEVEQIMGGEVATKDFFRLFLAPGVDHCGFGPTPGAVPTAPFNALLSWVENGVVPEILEAETLPNSTAHFTRKICRYPLVAKYRGRGDRAAAKNYVCVKPKEDC
ncbi:hypothetical protein G7Z17_g5504 [Cylindrodendrum hubeiense]|uniref:Carboxylic ester hydrolase n=1 Tax=Cylindrodendrum hubeiense TaxID=595255 RepID=A0A9P5LBP1_9HYPO|nr:hypothetical protein G7Z17_g5504 [Cylindrodendrum hubeiense]